MFDGLIGRGIGGSQDITGNAATVTVVDESADTTCFVGFFTAATGTLPIKTGTNLTFNSSTGVLTATKFAGALNGTVGATTPATIAGTTGSFSGIILTTDATDATSATAASLKTAGGIAAVKALWIGGTSRLVGVATMDADALIHTLTVGLGASAVATNTALGVAALANVTIGSQNTAVGYQAAQALTDGNSNTACGQHTLTATTEGIANVAMGRDTLKANTTGDNNTAIGRASLLSSITGDGNVALGFYAGAYELGSNAFYVDNQNRTDTAGDKAGAILYGVFNATPASQTLVVNAALTVAQTLAVTGDTGLGVAVAATTFLGLGATTTAKSSLNVPHGTAPTSPVNGDIWTTTAGLYVRINGGTVGPLTA